MPERWRGIAFSRFCVRSSLLNPQLAESIVESAASERPTTIGWQAAHGVGPSRRGNPVSHKLIPTMPIAHQTGGESMNDDPDNCTCERCDIDRERAPHQRAWLRALHEATTAQVSAALYAVGKRQPLRLTGGQWGPAGVDRPDDGAGKGTLGRCGWKGGA